MSTEARTQLLTAEEFYQLPDPIEGGKMELVHGEVITCMPVSRSHSQHVLRLFRAVDPFVLKHGLGELNVELGFRLARNPDVVRAPDLSYLDRLALTSRPMPAEGFVDGPPTLAIEVISPSELDREISEKVSEYLSAGVQRVWLVRPDERSVVVWHGDRTARQLQAGESLTSEDAGFAIEGFSLPLDELFAE